jgi:hypothetical protein
MANAKYPKYLERAMGAGLDLTTLDLKVVAVDLGAYTYSAAHEFLSDIPGGARIATSPNLASKVITNGVFDAADVTFAGFSGATVEALVIYQDTGVAGTSRLIAFFDTGVAGLPLTPTGAAQTVVWNASGIFAF